MRSALVAAIALVICWHWSLPVQARVIGLTYREGQASGGKAPGKITYDVKEFGVVILPWALCETALAALEEEKAGDDTDTRAANLAQLLAADDLDPGGHPGDTMLIIQPRRTKPIRVFVAAYHFDDSKPGIVEARISPLDASRANQLTSWAARLSVLRAQAVVQSDRGDGRQYLLGALIPYFEAFSAQGGAVEATTHLSSVLYEFTGPARAVMSNRGMEVWEFTAIKESTNESIWIRYSPLYGAVSSVSFPLMPDEPDVVFVHKLTSAYDSARNVPVAALAAPEVPKKRRGPYLAWFAAGACVVFVLALIALLVKRRIGKGRDAARSDGD